MMATASEHAPRRVAWDRAFSAPVLKSYMPLLSARVFELSDRLADFLGNGEVVDMAKWFSLFALDFMGDFVWGGAGGFCFMRSNTGRPIGDGQNPDNVIVEKMHEGAVAFGVLGAIPWIRPIVHALPMDGVAIMQEKSRAVLKRRTAVGNKTGGQDLFFHLVSALQFYFETVV
jgi:hypothetical protein